MAISIEFIHNPAIEGTQLARQGNDLVAVVFPQPLRTGQRMELRFVYGGEVLAEAGVGCSMLVREACGIQIADWPCPTSTWSFTIRPVGPW